ncbi:UNKNOWN [Stylonychia lemnae]|uniref:Nmda receptor glutamate-binding chain n=1 Tax=Stylonychia lemnae TaxID=5949 RepID=A0A078BAR0_STYLE|nr:UNKNOWN [Stylonychia lemnae]|eukprot:CDW90337.1 UNKNOWN [Stylonychia lemnae]
MEYTLGNTHSKDFQEFLIEDSQNRGANRQKQPKLSTITKQKRPNETQPIANPRDNPLKNGPGIAISRQAQPNRSSHHLNKKAFNGYLMPIPEEQIETSNAAMSLNDSNFNSNQKSDSSSSFVNMGNQSNPIKINSSGYPIFSSGTSDRSQRFISLGGGSVTGTAGARQFYALINQQDMEELQNFIRKMFSFFSLQKIFVAMWIIFVYNNVQFTQKIKENFFIFAISAFVYMTVLMMVHTALDFVRKSPQCNICYILFTISECLVVSFLLATTDGATVFLFTQCLTGIVLAITIFLYTNNVSWLRGIAAIALMLISMFILSISTLNQDYTDMITILLCMVGGLMFGIFLLSKAFQIFQNNYTHALTKDDYVIASMTIYVDFGFVLLVMLFVMLATIKSFTS